MHMEDVLAASIDRNRSQPIASLAAMVNVRALSPPESVSARQGRHSGWPSGFHRPRNSSMRLSYVTSRLMIVTATAAVSAPSFPCRKTTGFTYIFFNSLTFPDI